MNRRGFLKAILATGVAPAVVGSGVLMPVRQILAPRNSLLTISDITREALLVLERELVDAPFASASLVLTIDEFAEHVIRPSMRYLAEKIDRDWTVAA